MLKTYVCPIDVGYGYVKTLSCNPFPSVVLEIDEKDFLKVSDVDNSEGFLIQTEDGTFAVGESALRLSRLAKPVLNDYQRWNTKEYKALLLAGIAKQFRESTPIPDIYLVTGLPYLQSTNPEEVEGLKQTYTRDFFVKVLENGNMVDKRINIVRVDVLSQPRGAYYSLVSITQKRIKEQYALIADLGFKSLDYLLLDNGQESDDSNGEDAIAGMEIVYSNLIKELRSKGLPQVQPHEIDRWLNEGYLNRYQKEVDYHFDLATKNIVEDMKRKLGTAWSRLELMGAIYFVGGSAQRLQQYFNKYLPNTNVFFINGGSQQLIVEGYGAYGRVIRNKVWGVTN